MGLLKFLSRLVGSHRGEENSERNSKPLPPFEALETMFNIYAPKSRFLTRVHNDLRGMGYKSFRIFTEIPFFLQAISEGCTFLEKNCSEQVALQKLGARSVEDAERFVKALLIGDSATCNDVARDLMEIEALIMDFSLDPDRMELWLKQNETVAKDFAFGTLNKRLKVAIKIPKQYATPSYSEYMMHSEHLHPRADGRKPPLGDETDDFQILCFELSEHLLRVCTAIILFHSRDDEDETLTEARSSDLSKLFSLRGLFVDNMTRLDESLAEQGLKFPAREVYKISDFPAGVRFIPRENDSQ